MIFPRPLAALALASLWISGCGGSNAPATSGAMASPGSKLTDMGHGVLRVPQAPPEEPVELLNSTRSGGFGDWKLVGQVSEPLAGPKGLVSLVQGDADPVPSVTLTGQSGALYRFVEAKPNSYYAFSAQVRVEGIESQDDPFFGATPWIAELMRGGSDEELFQAGWHEDIYHREQFPTLSGTSDWTTRERIFVTGPETQTLLLTLCLAHTGQVSAGQVSFRSVRLEEVPRQVYLQTRLDRAVAVHAAGTEPKHDWRSQRLVRGNLGGEVRPSIVLLPGESLSFRLRLPEGEPRFESGVGFWDPSLGRGSELSQSFLVLAEGAFGKASAECTGEPNGDRSATRWVLQELDLSLAAGQEIELTLSLEGDVPGMFGAPRIVERSQRGQAPNVILVSIDTLRADHVGVYGASEGQTPRLDAFAREGLLFTRMVGQAPYTLPGHATILSGQYPGVHGLQKPGQLLSPLRSPLLTRILSRRGYATQAFTGGGYVNAEFGFARDFDGFVNLDPWRHRGSSHFQYLISRTPPPVKRKLAAADQGLYITREMVEEHGPEGVLRWISSHKAEPFFLFVHSFAIHDYEPPPGYLICAQAGCESKRTDYQDFKLKKDSEWGGLEISAADREHLKHRYDATLRYTDERFGELLDHLEREGLGDNTIVIVTTDHGEEMFERGFIQHGKSLYEELTRIPLIMRIPGQSPRVIDSPAMQVDILPTLLGAMGIEADERIQGIDLLQTQATERATWSEISDDFVELYSYRSADGWKLIHTPQDSETRFRLREEWQLFNLDEDPDETRNLAALEAAKLAELRRALEAQRAANAEFSRGFQELKVEVSEETLDALGNLGYTEGDEEAEDE